MILQNLVRGKPIPVHQNFYQRFWSLKIVDNPTTEFFFLNSRCKKDSENLKKFFKISRKNRYFQLIKPFWNTSQDIQQIRKVDKISHKAERKWKQIPDTCLRVVLTTWRTPPVDCYEWKIFTFCTCRIHYFVKWVRGKYILHHFIALKIKSKYYKNHSYVMFVTKFHDTRWWSLIQS